MGDHIHQQLPDHFLLEENGGIGYLASDSPIDPRHHYLQTWLYIFPGKYVGLSYGTNDFWGCGDPASIADRVYNTYVVMAQTVSAAGKIPIVPHMNWSPRPDLQTCTIAINGKIDQLYKKYPKVVPGPDLLYSFSESSRRLWGYGTPKRPGYWKVSPGMGKHVSKDNLSLGNCFELKEEVIIPNPCAITNADKVYLSISYLTDLDLLD